MQPSEVEAIAYSMNHTDGHTVVQKWGKKEAVNQWAEIARKTFIAAGYQDMGNEIHVLEVGNLPKEEVDKIMHCSGYVGKLIREKS